MNSIRKLDLLTSSPHILSGAKRWAGAGVDSGLSEFACLNLALWDGLSLVSYFEMLTNSVNVEIHHKIKISLQKLDDNLQMTPCQKWYC